MTFRNWVTVGALVLWLAWDSLGQSQIVQPGAPGTAGRTLTPAAAVITPKAPSEADITFMQGMIMHHSQAVEMTALMPSRTRNKKLLALGARISISQSDEIRYMKQWLEERGKPEFSGGAHMMHHMPGMDMPGMEMKMKTMDKSTIPLMSGMLSPAQMKALAASKGAEYDRLFLSGMIQHHGGALTMVQDLFDTPGAGQDAVLFDFATDIDNTQRAEINIMQSMLKENK
jgi:uncharacterized protein (DUF305 family)